MTVGPEDVLAGHPLALAAFERVQVIVAAFGPIDVRASKSQVAFRRRRAFAFIWVPGRYLPRPGADVVVSIALTRHDPSPRWKQVAHPSARIWMHHLELHAIGDLDGEVRAWLQAAWDAAG
jgi:hypothetical protein